MYSWLRHEGNRHTEIQWEGTLRERPKPQQSRRIVLTGRRCWFVLVCSWMKAQLTQPLLCYTNPQSRKNSFLPSSISAERGSKAVGQPVQQQCAQVSATLSWTVESPESPPTWAVLLGERCMQLFTLALILSGQNMLCYLAFQLLENLYLKRALGPILQK